MDSDMIQSFICRSLAVVVVPELKKTTAELSMEEKNEISHRGNALRKMKKNIIKYL